MDTLNMDLPPHYTTYVVEQAHMCEPMAVVYNFCSSNTTTAAYFTANADVPLRDNIAKASRKPRVTSRTSSYDYCSSEILQRTTDFETSVQASRSGCSGTFGVHHQTFSALHNCSFSSSTEIKDYEFSWSSNTFSPVYPEKGTNDNATSYSFVNSSSDKKNVVDDPTTSTRSNTEQCFNSLSKNREKKVSVVMRKRLSFRSKLRRRWTRTLKRWTRHKTRVCTPQTNEPSGEFKECGTETDVIVRQRKSAAISTSLRWPMTLFFKMLSEAEEGDRMLDIDTFRNSCESQTTKSLLHLGLRNLKVISFVPSSASNTRSLGMDITNTDPTPTRLPSKHGDFSPSVIAVHALKHKHCPSVVQCCAKQESSPSLFSYLPSQKTEKKNTKKKSGADQKKSSTNIYDGASPSIVCCHSKEVVKKKKKKKDKKSCEDENPLSEILDTISRSISCLLSEGSVKEQKKEKKKDKHKTTDKKQKSRTKAKTKTRSVQAVPPVGLLSFDRGSRMCSSTNVNESCIFNLPKPKDSLSDCWALKTLDVSCHVAQDDCPLTTNLHVNSCTKLMTATDSVEYTKFKSKKHSMNGHKVTFDSNVTGKPSPMSCNIIRSDPGVNSGSCRISETNVNIQSKTSRDKKEALSQRISKDGSTFRCHIPAVSTDGSCAMTDAECVLVFKRPYCLTHKRNVDPDANGLVTTTCIVLDCASLEQLREQILQNVGKLKDVCIELQTANAKFQCTSCVEGVNPKNSTSKVSPVQRICTSCTAGVSSKDSKSKVAVQCTTSTGGVKSEDSKYITSCSQVPSTQVPSCLPKFAKLVCIISEEDNSKRDVRQKQSKDCQVTESDNQFCGTVERSSAVAINSKEDKDKTQVYWTLFPKRTREAKAEGKNNAEPSGRCPITRNPCTSCTFADPNSTKHESEGFQHQSTKYTQAWNGTCNQDIEPCQCAHTATPAPSAACAGPHPNFVHVDKSEGCHPQCTKDTQTKGEAACSTTQVNKPVQNTCCPCTKTDAAKNSKNKINFWAQSKKAQKSLTDFINAAFPRTPCPPSADDSNNKPKCRKLRTTHAQAGAKTNCSTTQLNRPEPCMSSTAVDTKEGGPVCQMTKDTQATIECNSDTTQFTADNQCDCELVKCVRYLTNLLSSKIEKVKACFVETHVDEPQACQAVFRTACPDVTFPSDQNDSLCQTCSNTESAVTPLVANEERIQEIVKDVPAYQVVYNETWHPKIPDRKAKPLQPCRVRPRNNLARSLSVTNIGSDRQDLKAVYHMLTVEGRTRRLTRNRRHY